MANSDERQFLFEVLTPLAFRVHCTHSFWNFVITYKHPVLRGQERHVQRALEDPDQVRRSRKDSQVFLFYRSFGSKWLCAVAKRENDAGFLITAYPTDAIKIGETVWTR
jgi:hypothetical protein